MKKIFRKIRRFILMSITWIMGILWFLSAFSLDSPSWIPTITLAFSTAWLIPFGIANGWIEF